MKNFLRAKKTLRIFVFMKTKRKTVIFLCKRKELTDCQKPIPCSIQDWFLGIFILWSAQCFLILN
jgi:hypothetical protein